MRNTLIDLINDFIHEVDVKRWYSQELDEGLADSLLASEQVIVLPCKPGTKIYHIGLKIPEDEIQCSACANNCSGFEEFWCDEGYVGWPSMEDKLIHPGDVCPKFKPIIKEETFTMSFWARNDEWFNRTWFLTEDEANKALEDFKNQK